MVQGCLWDISKIVHGRTYSNTYHNESVRAHVYLKKYSNSFQSLRCLKNFIQKLPLAVIPMSVTLQQKNIWFSLK